MKGFISVFLIFVFLILCVNSFFVVSQIEYAIILQFGEFKKAITEPGLKFKLPFIQSVTFFDNRILEWDGEANQIPTADKKFIWVDTTARWKIVDPYKFYISVRNQSGAYGRLDDIIDGITREKISSYPLIEIVRNSNKKIETEEYSHISDESKGIKKGRNAITKEIENEARKICKEKYGIEIVDMLIKRVDYVDSVKKKVYTRMIEERKKIAEKYRSEGAGDRAEILGKIDKELKRITSEAYKKSQTIKGDADAKAIKIYAQSYNKNPRFYDFITSLKNYEKSIDTKTKLIISTKNNYLKFLK